jgi:putative oxidoreductase
MSASTDLNYRRTALDSRNAPSPARSPADRMAAQTHDAVLLVARVLLAYMFVVSGFGKLMDIGGFTASLVGKGVPMASVLGIIAPCVEFFGGLAVLLGVKTRYAALLMFLFTLVAALVSHRFWELTGAARQPQLVNFEKNTAIMGGFLLLFLLGAGRSSLDAWFRRRDR